MLNSKNKATIVAGICIFSLLNVSNAAPLNPVVKLSDNVAINFTPKPINKIGNSYTVNGMTFTPKFYDAYEVTSLASWYGADFHGKQTSNGEVFDMHELTASHPTLPLPSFVEVTNLENGKKIIVRVNDRGPFKEGRLIDVSEKAADILGFKDNGLARVKIRLVSADDARAQNEHFANEKALNVVEVKDNSTNNHISELSTDTASVRLVSLQEPNSVKSYVPRGVFVQIGAFGVEAEKLQKDVVSLSDVGVVSIQKVDLDGKSVLRLRVGPYGSIDDAMKIKDRLTKLGYTYSRVVVEQ